MTEVVRGEVEISFASGQGPLAQRSSCTMEHWRAFFGKANADIWIIIQQAINLAAIDYPKEFKEKRGEIAEILFERRLLHLDESVEVNKANLSEEGELRDDEEEEAGVGKAQDHWKRDGSSYDGAGGMQKEEVLLQEIECVKETISQTDHLDNVILDSLQKLEDMQITVDALKVTEIGKHVNSLRKHPSKRVRAIVKRLVRHWKDLVDEWVKSSGDETAAGLDTAGGDDVSQERGKSSPLADKSVMLANRNPDGEVTKLFSFLSNEMCGQTNSREEEPSVKDNIYYSSRSHSGSMLTDSSDKGSTSHTWGLRTPEEMGSATRDILPPGKLEFPRAPTIQSDKEHQESLRVGLSVPNGPGRPSYDVSKTRVTSGSPALTTKAVEQPNNKNGSSQRTAVAQSSINYKNSKVAASNNSAFVEKSQVDQKLEIAKRKLHQGYQQAENAKKQRTVQVLDFPDLPKAAQAQGKVNASAQSKQSGQWSQSRRYG